MLGNPIGDHIRIIDVFDYEITFEDQASYPKSFKKVDDYINHPLKMASQNYLN